MGFPLRIACQVNRSSICSSRLYPLTRISGQLEGWTICRPPRGKVDAINTCALGMARAIASKIWRYGRLSPLADLISALISADVEATLVFCIALKSGGLVGIAIENN